MSTVVLHCLLKLQPALSLSVTSSPAVVSARLPSNDFVTFDTSNTICALPLAINCIRFGLQLTLQEGSYKCQAVTHIQVVTHLIVAQLPNLSYRDKIKVQVENRYSLIYPNASLSKPPLSNQFTRWQGC